MKRMSEIYTAYCAGKYLNNDEVVAGQKFYAQLASDLSKAGKEFKFAFIGALNIADGLYDCAKARNLDVEK